MGICLHVKVLCTALSMSVAVSAIRERERMKEIKVVSSHFNYSLTCSNIMSRGCLAKHWDRQSVAIGTSPTVQALSSLIEKICDILGRYRLLSGKESHYHKSEKNIHLLTNFYVAYYQSGGEGYSVAFTIDSLERDNRHELTDLPVGRVHSISLVALVDLLSPVAGPVTPGEYMLLWFYTLCKLSNHSVFQLLRLQ